MGYYKLTFLIRQKYKYEDAISQLLDVPSIDPQLLPVIYTQEKKPTKNYKTKSKNIDKFEDLLESDKVQVMRMEHV